MFDLGATTGVSLDSNVSGAGNTEWSSNPSSSENAAWNDPQLVADNANVTAATINEIREAFQVQRMYERDARGGTRLTEIIKSHFGVTSPDARLQRPEYLGGSTTPMNITAVPSMYGDGTVPQGELAGYGVVSGSNGHGFTKSFTEHCVIIGLVSVRADLNYQEGINKQWLRSTRWDYYWPTFAHLGEQVVQNQELYADGSANDLLPWGVPRKIR